MKGLFYSALAHNYLNTPLAIDVMVYRPFLSVDGRAFPGHPSFLEVDMRISHMLGGAVAIVLLTGSTFAAEGLKSGPQVGSRKIPAFNPLHCNGSGAGGKACLV
jgi:hypothetical protein